MEMKEKASVKKKSFPAKVVSEKPIYAKSENKSENLLIENFVSLQRVMVNLSSKFDTLSNRISKLLDIFEISAKALAEKDFSSEKDTKESEKIFKKVDVLTEQNKIIARGLTLMNAKLSGEPEPQITRMPAPNFPRQRAPPLRAIPGQNVISMQNQGFEGYEKSISSNKSESQNIPR